MRSIGNLVEVLCTHSANVFTKMGLTEAFLRLSNKNTKNFLSRLGIDGMLGS